MFKATKSTDVGKFFFYLIIALKSSYQSCSITVLPNACICIVQQWRLQVWKATTGSAISMLNAAAMDVPLQSQAFRCFSLSYSLYTTTEACWVEEGSTSCIHWAICWLHRSCYGFLSSSASVLKTSSIAPGIREGRELTAWKWHSQCPHVAEVTKKKQWEEKNSALYSPL